MEPASFGKKIGSDAQAGTLAGAGAVVELVGVSGQQGVEQDAGDGGDGQTGQVDGHTGHHEGQTAHRVEAQGADQDDSGDDQVAGVGEVHLVFHHVAHADGGDHAVQHEADAADDAGGDGVDDGIKLGAEAQHDGKHGGNADDQGIVDLGQGQHAGVFTVGGVGGAAQQAGHAGGQTVTQQGAVQAGVTDEVLAGGGADGSDVADVLHHGGQGDGHDGQHGADEFGAAVNGEQTHGLGMHRNAEPGGVGHAGKVHCAGDQSHHIGHDDTQQDGQDLDHALAPDVADDDGAQGHKGSVPVGLTLGSRVP